EPRPHRAPGRAAAPVPAAAGTAAGGAGRPVAVPGHAHRVRPLRTAGHLVRGKLAGRVAIVVGGGQTDGETTGNGRAACLTYAREGAAVLVVDRDPDAAEQTVKL